MFHCYLTFRRFYKTAERNEYLTEMYHIEAPDEKTIRKVGCALSGLMKQMDIDHDVNFAYVPDRRS